MEQLDVFDFLAELSKSVIDDDVINNRAINRLLKIIENPRSKDSDVNNAAKLLLQITGKLVSKKQIDHTVHAPKDLNDFYNEQ